MNQPQDGYLLYDADGNAIGYGTGLIQPAEGETVVYSADPFNEPDVLKIQNESAEKDKIYSIHSLKTSDAYAGKAENAYRWIRNNPTGDTGDYTAELYPWMAIEVEAKSETPRAIAESIVGAITREHGSLEQERERVALRESVKSS